MTCGRRPLSILAFTLGALTLLFLSIAVATDFWIYVSEPALIDAKTEVVLEYQVSRMGLWKKCSLIENQTTVCHSIESVESNRHAILNKTIADLVAISVNSTCAFPVAALLLVLLSVVVGIVSSIRQEKHVLLASILFVIAGLAMIVGLILFISAVNDEVAPLPGAKLKNPTIRYWYSWSFLLASSSFLLAEGTGVTGIYLFFRENSSLDDMIHIIPGLEDMIPEDQRKDQSLGYTNFNVIS